MIDIEGVKPSSEIRAELASEGRPVLLAFSCGKDAIASWIALRDAGVGVVPYYMYYVPGLQFVEDSLAYFEDFFGQRIARYPHESLYRWLNNFTFQAPERLAVIEAADLPSPTYADIVSLIKADRDLPADTWVADGVRAADSIVRRVSIKRYGAMKQKNRKASVVWDWQIAELRAELAAAGVQLPIDYDWFGRSFDGLDFRFLDPIRQNAPDDYQRILDWFPMAELEVVRHGI